MRLLAEGRSLDEIAAIRERRRSTIVSMVSDLVVRGMVEFQPAWVDQGRKTAIEAACAKFGMERLSPLKEALPPDFTYDEIRLVVAMFAAGMGIIRGSGAVIGSQSRGIRLASVPVEQAPARLPAA